MREFFYGVIGAVIMSILFSFYNIMAFNHKYTNIPVMMFLEKRKKLSVIKQSFELEKDPMLVTYKEGKMQPVGKLKDLIKNSKKKGAIVLVWTTSCVYCAKQIKMFYKFSKRYPQIKTFIVGAGKNIEEAHEKYKKVLGEKALPHFLYDHDYGVINEVFRNMNETPVPFYALFSKEGKLIGRVPGTLFWDELGPEIVKTKFTE